MGLRQPGDPVNIETDMVAKYIERFTQQVVPRPANRTKEVSSVDEALLKETGYM
jgi:riboflavin synthase alpha subunit